MNRIKNNLVIVLTNLFIKFTNFVAKAGFIQEKKSSVLILPPTDSGSLGDQAMVTAVVNYYREIGVKKIGLICYKSVSDCQNFYPDVKVFKYSNSFDFVRLVSHYEKFFCLGADVMDGFYSEKRSLLRAKLVGLAAEVGTESSILGFSFNSEPKNTCIDALQKLPQNVRLCARDPISYERIVNHVKRPVELVADLAFLLPPDNHSKVSSEVLKFVSENQSQKRIVIGINANCKLLDNLKIKTPENLTKIYVDTLVDLSRNKETSFVLIPHDFREKDGAISDITFARMIMNSLPPEIKSFCIEVPTPCSAADIKAICREIDIVLTGRMHLAIASLGQATPVACITYQGKFKGLFQHFELDDLTISPEKAIISDNLSKFMMPLIQKRGEIGKHISSKLPHIYKLAKANFK